MSLFIIMIFSLFFFSISEKPKEQFSMKDFIVGEWDVFNSSRILEKGRKLVPDYTAVMNFNEKSAFLDGIIWKNNINSTEVQPIEDFIVGNVEVVFTSDFGGQVYSLVPERHLMTTFVFTPNLGFAFSTKGKIDGGHSFHLTLVNGTFFTFILTTPGRTKAQEFIINRARKIEEPPGMPKYVKWLMFGAIGLIIFQVVMWIALKSCKSAIDVKIDQFQRENVIDLDAQAKQIKTKKKDD